MAKYAGDGHVARIHAVSTCPFARVACSMHNTQYSERAYPSSGDATRRARRRLHRHRWPHMHIQAARLDAG